MARPQLADNEHQRKKAAGKQELSMRKIKQIMNEKLEHVRAHPSHKFSLRGLSDRPKHKELRERRDKQRGVADRFMGYQALVNNEEVPKPIGKEKLGLERHKHRSQIDLSE